jgi:predicted ATPase
VHLKNVTFHPESYPTEEWYPFNLSLFHQPQTIPFSTPVTLFAGENGTGKSTLLEALAHICGIHIWREAARSRFTVNPHEESFHRYLTIEWTAERVPGSFFSSGIFNHFARILDEWAAADPGQLKYFGGSSLITQSHGQSLMSYFKSRYRIKGLYLLDEPETALSPGSQLELLKILTNTSGANHAQFIIATHSPLLLACPGAVIYSFDSERITPVRYEDTAHYTIYRSFMEDRSRYV